MLRDFISEGYSQQCILYLGCCQVTFKDGALPLGLHPHVTVLRIILELYPTCHRCALYWEIISQHFGIVEQCFESKLALTSNSAEDFFIEFLPLLKWRHYFCLFCFVVFVFCLVGDFFGICCFDLVFVFKRNKIIVTLFCVFPWFPPKSTHYNLLYKKVIYREDDGGKSCAM